MNLLLPKRLKEQLVDGLELSPVRLLGGFICVDFHFGCIGCSYCLNRRHPVLHQILERGLQFDAGLSLERLGELLGTLPSFTRARVPLRIGHVTDWFYEQEETARFCEWLPSDYPAVLMTRFPLTEGQRRLVGERRNLLVHLTVTPPAPGASSRLCDAALDSTRRLPREGLVTMFRPLVSGDPGPTQALLDQLPAGSFVAFKGLSTNDIPGLDPALRKVTAEEVLALRAHAVARGLIPVDMFGCVFRERMGLPFFKHHEIADRSEDSHCRVCRSRALCEATLAPLPRAALDEELARLEVPAESVRIDGAVVRVETWEPASRAEEVYLSELLSRDVRLSSVPRGQTAGVADLGGRVFERQERAGFLPVTQLRALSAALEARISRPAAKARRSPRSLRVLLVGRSVPEWSGDVWLARSFEELSNTVDFFDIRLQAAQLDPVAVEQRLAAVVRAGSYDLVLITRGGILSVELLREIRQHTHLHFRYVDTNPASVAAVAELCHTTSASAPGTARALGGEYVVEGCYPASHFPGSPREELASELTFIGRPYANRQRLVTSLVRRGFDVATFGSGGWAGRHGRRKLADADFRDAVASAAINLAIDPVTPYDSFHSNRVFLLLACQGFVLCNRLPELEELFIHGEHLVFFDDEDDLEVLARRYLDRPAERAAISAEGRRHVLERFTLSHTAQRILDVVSG